MYAKATVKQASRYASIKVHNSVQPRVTLASTETGVLSLFCVQHLDHLDHCYGFVNGTLTQLCFCSCPCTVSMQADLMLALGVRFDDRVTGKLEAFATHARIVHIDVDPAEIHKNKHAHIPICAGVSTTC